MQRSWPYRSKPPGSVQFAGHYGNKANPEASKQMEEKDEGEWGREACSSKQWYKTGEK